MVLLLSLEPHQAGSPQRLSKSTQPVCRGTAPTPSTYMITTNPFVCKPVVRQYPNITTEELEIIIIINYLPSLNPSFHFVCETASGFLSFNVTVYSGVKLYSNVFREGKWVLTLVSSQTESIEPL